MKASEIGEQAYKQFKEERLEAIQPKNKFHDPMKLKKLKTLSSLSKKRNVTADGRTMILKADRSLFGRIIILGQNRKIEVRELLHYSLGPLPWALATPEWFPRKTNKASLATYLQKDIHLADSVPRNSTTIIDGMSLVQKLLDEAKQHMECLHLRFCRWLYTRVPRVRELTWLSIHTDRCLSKMQKEPCVEKCMESRWHTSVPISWLNNGESS